jgi:hypothetical protein
LNYLHIYHSRNYNIFTIFGHISGKILIYYMIYEIYINKMILCVYE